MIKVVREGAKAEGLCCTFGWATTTTAAVVMLSSCCRHAFLRLKVGW